MVHQSLHDVGMPPLAVGWTLPGRDDRPSTAPSQWGKPKYFKTSHDLLQACFWWYMYVRSYHVHNNWNCSLQTSLTIQFTMSPYPQLNTINYAISTSKMNTIWITMSPGCRFTCVNGASGCPTRSHLLWAMMVNKLYNLLLYETELPT